MRPSRWTRIARRFSAVRSAYFTWWFERSYMKKRVVFPPTNAQMTLLKEIGWSIGLQTPLFGVFISNHARSQTHYAYETGIRLLWWPTCWYLFGIPEGALLYRREWQSLVYCLHPSLPNVLENQ